MDTLTLIDQKEQLRKKAEELITNAEKEIRKLNDCLLYTSDAADEL